MRYCTLGHWSHVTSSVCIHPKLSHNRARLEHLTVDVDMNFARQWFGILQKSSTLVVSTQFSFWILKVQIHISVQRFYLKVAPNFRISIWKESVNPLLAHLVLGFAYADSLLISSSCGVYHLSWEKSAASPPWPLQVSTNLWFEGLLSDLSLGNICRLCCWPDVAELVSTAMDNREWMVARADQKNESRMTLQVSQKDFF